MPIKWTAPEILSGNFAELSTQSDVYVQYEFFRLCLSSGSVTQGHLSCNLIVLKICDAIARQVAQDVP